MLPPTTTDNDPLSRRPGPPTPGETPDDSLDISERIELFEAWVRRNSRAITVVLVIVMIGAVGWAGYREHRHAILMEANDALAVARDTFQDALQGTRPASPERTAKMREARAQLENVIASKAPAGLRGHALFLKAETFFYEGDASPEAANARQAARLFAEAAANAPTPLDRAAALYAEGVAHENIAFLTRRAEDRAAAARLFDQVIAMGEAAQFLAWEARNGKARLLLDEGRTEEAEKLFREVYDARWQPAPIPPGDADATQQMRAFVGLLRERLAAGSAGGYAREQLIRLGVDVEALDAAKRNPAPRR